LFTLLWLPAVLNLVVYFLILLSLTVFVVLDGVRSARIAKPDYQLAPYNRWYVYVLVIVGVGVVDSLILDVTRSHVVQSFQMGSPSMEPALLPGDHLFADRTAYLFSEPRRGDFAIYPNTQFPKIIHVQRIVGLPGETIEIRERVVFINGRKLDEPYVNFVRPTSASEAPGDSMPPLLLPDDAYFILGDNRDNSNDSRFSGSIKRQDLRGRAVKTVWFSWDSENSQVRWSRTGKVPN